MKLYAMINRRVDKPLVFTIQYKMFSSHYIHNYYKNITSHVIQACIYFFRK